VARQAAAAHVQFS